MVEDSRNSLTTSIFCHSIIQKKAIQSQNFSPNSKNKLEPLLTSARQQVTSFNKLVSLVQFLVKQHLRIMALHHEEVLFLKAVDETVLFLKADKLVE